jgi:hypothetical protein
MDRATKVSRLRSFFIGLVLWIRLEKAAAGSGRNRSQCNQGDGGNALQHVARLGGRMALATKFRREYANPATDRELQLAQVFRHPHPRSSGAS